MLVLIAVLLTAAIQPLGELANILKEKVVLNAALMNSGRAAHNNALNIWHMMNLEARVNENDFIELFSEAFSRSLNLSHNFIRSANVNNTVVFTSNDEDERFNPITVEFSFEHNIRYSDIDDIDFGDTVYHDRPVTVVTVRMETPYLFRTFLLRQANGVSNDDYLITETRKFLLQVIN